MKWSGPAMGLYFTSPGLLTLFGSSQLNGNLFLTPKPPFLHYCYFQKVPKAWHFRPREAAEDMRVTLYAISRAVILRTESRF